ncbi:MAG: hypothetical protein M3Y24_13150 [Acidobacteriota bacterium]|nr:hypothetical protein [Acidobacteriota bacterium]
MHVLEPAWETLKRDFDSACLAARRTARSQLTAELNQIFRRLRHYENEEQWIAAVRDGAAKFSGAFGLFTSTNRTLHLRAQVNLDAPADLTFETSSASAFAAAIESGEPTVALRTPGEVGSALSVSDLSARVRLFRIANAGRTVALLFVVEDEAIDVDALELVSDMAAAVLERQSNQALHSKIAPAPAPEEAAKLPLGPDEKRKISARPAWADLDDNQRALHIKAQRFSRVAVAEMQLLRPEACRAGRKQSNLYMLLQTEIDKAREAYGRQFMKIPSMVDYLHLELVKIAAEGDQEKLGADYPGQLA